MDITRPPLRGITREEVAFRGVLQAALRRVLAEPAVTAVASVVFGICLRPVQARRVRVRPGVAET